MTTLTVKSCNDCGEEKTITDFCKLSGKYLRSYCKSCGVKRTGEWAKNNRDKMRLSYNKHTHKHRGKVNALARNNHNKGRKLLKNSYINGVLYHLSKGVLHKEDLTDEIIELKRLQLTLYRLIKEKSSQQSQSV